MKLPPFYHHFDVIKEGGTAPAKLTVRVCESVSCEMHGAKDLLQDLNSLNSDDVRIQRVPCVGRCADAPVAVVGTKPVAKADKAQVLQLIDTNDIEDDIPADAVNYVDYQADGVTHLLRLVTPGSVRKTKSLA